MLIERNAPLNIVLSAELSTELSIDQFYAVCEQLNFNEAERKRYLQLFGLEREHAALQYS